MAHSQYNHLFRNTPFHLHLQPKYREKVWILALTPVIFETWVYIFPKNHIPPPPPFQNVFVLSFSHFSHMLFIVFIPLFLKYYPPTTRPGAEGGGDKIKNIYPYLKMHTNNYLIVNILYTGGGGQICEYSNKSIMIIKKSITSFLSQLLHTHSWETSGFSGSGWSMTDVFLYSKSQVSNIQAQ